jgi:hypothetical protein
MKRESCFGCWLSSSLRPRLGANERTPLSPPFEGLVVVLALIWVAWLVSRAAGRVATFIVLRGERKHAPGIEDTGVIASLKQRRRRSRSRGRACASSPSPWPRSSRLACCWAPDLVATVAGASFVVILLAFAAQRFLRT